MRTERTRLSRHAPVAKAIDYMLKRWDGFTRFLDDGRICLTNNAAERAIRGIALGRQTLVAVRRLRPRRRAGRGDVHPHRHHQAQRRRPAGLARRCAGPHRRAAAHPGARVAALELESRPGPSPRPHRPALSSRSVFGPPRPAVLPGCLRINRHGVGQTRRRLDQIPQSRPTRTRQHSVFERSAVMPRFQQRVPKTREGAQDPGEHRLRAITGIITSLTFS